jgi:AcrR family transcriptional regulator
MSKIIPAKSGTKKDAITKKAMVLFHKKGFASTSMRDIAESMGVVAPSLYNHINSKNELLANVCFRIAGLFTSHLKKVELSKISALAKIEKILRFHIAMMVDEYESVYIAEHEWRHLTGPDLPEFKNQRRNYRLRLAAILQKGIDTKEILPVNAHVAVLTLLSAIGGVEDWQKSGRKIAAPVLADNMVNILIGGLKNK